MLRSSILALCVALSPVVALAESTLAIAGASNGLYMSRDRGVTWEKNAALGEVAVRAVAIDRSDLNRLYAATQDALLISRDGGGSWSAGRFPEPATIRQLVSGPAGLVLARAGNTAWSSSDGGVEWAVESGLPAGVWDLAVDAGDPPTIYAATSSGIFTKSGGSAWMGLSGHVIANRIAADPDVPGRLFAALGSVHVLMDGHGYPYASSVASTADGGVTWTELPSIPMETVLSAVGAGFSGDFELDVDIEVTALTPGVGAGDVSALIAVCITWDGSFFGCSWAPVSARDGQWRAGEPLNRFMEVTTFAGNRAANLKMVGGVPYNRPRGSGLYYSSLAGDSWVPARVFDGVTVNSIAIEAAGVEPWSQVHVGTNEGLFSSTDRGETWLGNAALGKTDVFAIGVDRGGSGLLLASTPEGLFRSTDAGASWEKPELLPEIQAGVIAVDPKPDGRAYLVEKDPRGANGLRLWTSEDRGRSWYQAASQPAGIRDVALDPKTSPATVYVAGTYGIQKSIDEARTWTSIDNRSFARFVRVGEPAGTIYRDGEDGIWTTTNDGESWELRAPLTQITNPDPSGPNLLWEWIETGALAIGTGRNYGLIAGCATYFAWFFGPGAGNIETSGLFIVNGNGWDAFSLGETCTAVDIDPRAVGLVYAGGLGLRRSLDGGRSWSAAPGFSNRLVNTIVTGPRAPAITH